MEDAFIIRVLAEDKKLDSKVIGHEGSMGLLSAKYQRREMWNVGLPFYQRLRDTLPRAETRGISPLLYDLRSVKTSNEVHLMRIVNRIAGIGLEAFHRTVREGMREVDVQAAVVHELITKGVGYGGVERLVPMAFVMSGRNSADPYKTHNVSTENKLRMGDLVLVELNINAEPRSYGTSGKTLSVRRPFPTVQTSQVARKRKLRSTFQTHHIAGA
jgi:Xaa-Pro aminopeptidase